MLRSVCAATLLALAVSPATAGGCVGDCYRQAYSPPVYKAYVEKAMLRAPRTYALVTPAQYGVVHETVMVHPGSRRWSVTYDDHGRKVGCWVTTPARYASVPRKVMLRQPEAVPYAVPAEYGLRTETVMVQGPTKTWQPIGPSYRGH